MIETNTRRIRQQLLREGWRLARPGNKHDIYWHSVITEQIQLPRHREVSPGVARSIAKIAGWEA